MNANNAKRVSYDIGCMKSLRKLPDRVTAKFMDMMTRYMSDASASRLSDALQLASISDGCCDSGGCSQCNASKTPLINAARQGRSDIVAALLAEGVDANEPTNRRNRSLHAGLLNSAAPRVVGLGTPRGFRRASGWCARAHAAGGDV